MFMIRSLIHICVIDSQFLADPLQESDLAAHAHMLVLDQIVQVLRGLIKVVVDEDVVIRLDAFRFHCRFFEALADDVFRLRAAFP